MLVFEGVWKGSRGEGKRFWEGWGRRYKLPV